MTPSRPPATPHPTAPIPLRPPAPAPPIRGGWNVRRLTMYGGGGGYPRSSYNSFASKTASPIPPLCLCCSFLHISQYDLNRSYVEPTCSSLLLSGPPHTHTHIHTMNEMMAEVLGEAAQSSRLLLCEATRKARRSLANFPSLHYRQ